MKYRQNAQMPCYHCDDLGAVVLGFETQAHNSKPGHKTRLVTISGIPSGWSLWKRPYGGDNTVILRCPECRASGYHNDTEIACDHNGDVRVDG
jgi:hypothetical protein